MNTARVFFPALGVGFVFTFGGGEAIAFHPEPGSSVTKTFTSGGEYELDDLSLIVNGEDMGGMLGQLEMSMKALNTIEVTDAYKAVADGRPTELLRTFDALSGSMHMDVSAAGTNNTQNMDSSSVLEGKTVAFKWNAEKGEYERSFHESEGESKLLEDLEEDMDLRVFLPDSEVAVDATWTVELEQMMSLVMPGGDLSLTPQDGPDDGSMDKFKEIFSQFGEQFGELLEGECKCTFKGARDENGVRVAEIAIELDVAATMDLTEMLDKAIQAAIEQSGAGEMVKFSLDTADLNLDFEGAGTLLWNLKAGRMLSFQMAGDATIEMDLAVGVEAQGQSQNVDASLKLAGSMHEEVALKE